MKLTVAAILETREQQIIYRITKDLLRDHFADEKGNLQFHRFHELGALVREWYHAKVHVLGRGPEWKKLLYFADPKKLVAHVSRGIQTGSAAGEAIRPLLNYYNPTGSSRFVHGNTTRETYPTRHSHVNAVVIDSGWEGQAAKVLDDLAGEGHVNSWVKNAFLDFRVPYTDAAGEQRNYLPDFIVNCRLAGGRCANVIVEVTGFDRDKEAKRWTILNRWLPAVNRIRQQQGWDKWDFLELDEQRAVADFRNLLLARLRELALAEPLSGVWAARRDDELQNGLWMDDFEIPERRRDLGPYINPLD